MLESEHQSMSVAAGLMCFRCESRVPQDDLHQHLRCGCGGPLLQQYALERIDRTRRHELAGRPRGIWRYREFLPVIDDGHIYTLAEGDTPLIKLPSTGREAGLLQLIVKDEGRNPTGTFKARGASVGISRLAELGYERLAMPTVGSGGSAWSAYAARAGLRLLVGLPSQGGIPAIGPLEAAGYGGDVHTFPGHTAKAFRSFRSFAEAQGAPVVGAFLEPYRLEGEKTIGYEIAEQFHWQPPDWIVWPTGGGVGLVGLAKAFSELEQVGWLDGPRPGLIAVQVEGCAPIVDMIAGNGLLEARAAIRTESIAPGITVPDQPFADLVVGMGRQQSLLAAAVSEDDILKEIASVAVNDGLLLSPEGAAGVAAAKNLSASGQIAADTSVVVVNTASGLRYPHVLELIQRAA